MPVFTATADEAAPASDKVTVRVTKRGHGKISTGNHHATHGEEFFAEGETFTIARDIADELADENGDRRFVVIVPDEVDDADAKPAVKAKA